MGRKLGVGVGRTRSVALVGVFATMMLIPMAPGSATSRYSVSAYSSSSSVVTGHAVRLHGRVWPRAAGTLVRVQRYSSGAWHTTKLAWLNRESRYSVAVRLSGVGTAQLRVVKLRGHGEGRGVSRVLTVSVLPASAPSISPAVLPPASDGIAYSAALRTVGGRTGAWSWQPTQARPSWLHLGVRTGVLTGTPGPADVGVSNLAVRFTDAVGRTANAVVPLAVTDWTSLIVGSLQSCGIKNDHTAWCWGANDFGQSGSTRNVGALSPNDVPAQVGTGSDWQSLAAGDFHTCGIRTDSSAWCWGLNTSGQLGTNTNSGTNTPNTQPIQVGGTNWSQLTAGHEHTCGLKTDHTLWCWGANDYGQLGSGATAGSLNPNPTPVQVGSDYDWASVSADGFHTCALRTDHTLWCWGVNDFGQLGSGLNSGTATPQPTPLQVNGSWAAVSTGDRFTCATRTDGTLWCWGRNTYGALASTTNNGTNTPDPNPQQVGSSTDWRTVAAGLDHACAVKTDGTTWCWGDNTFGESAASNLTGPTTTPTQLGTDTSWAELTAGWGSTCALRTDGTAWCWGINDAGQLGSNTNSGTDSPNPTPVQVGTG